MATDTATALVRFSRDAADLTDAKGIFERLASAIDEEVHPAGLAIFKVGDGGLPELATTDAPAWIRSRAATADIVDSQLGQYMLQSDGHRHAEARTYLIASAGNLYGGLVALFDAPPSEEQNVLSGALADLAGMALDRTHSTMALRSTIDELERRREERAQARALEVLGQMSAIIAHEVRNPLASVGGVLQIFQSRLPAGGPDQEIIGKVLNRLASLNALLEELLDFSRPRKPNRQLIDIRGLLDEACAALQADPKQSGLTIQLHGKPSSLQIDPLMIRSVVDNLLINASHATNGTGKIQVSAHTDSGRCRIEVADNGTGIPDEIVGRVFDPFATSKPMGTGLGLALAKRIMDSHDGEISFETSPRGTTFQLVFPVSEFT